MSNSDDAEKAKKSAMDQVEENANELWLEFMADLVWDVCRMKKQFTTDDVFDLYDEAPEGKPTTHELRAMGPVMSRVAKEGLCKKANVLGQSSRRRSRHAAPLTVWDSLIYEGQ